MMGRGRLGIMGVRWLWAECCCMVMGRWGLGIMNLASLGNKITCGE